MSKGVRLTFWFLTEDGKPSNETYLLEKGKDLKLRDPSKLKSLTITLDGFVEEKDTKDD